MISAKLVHRIGDHWEHVSVRFFRLMRSSPDMPHFAHMPDSGLTEVCRREVQLLKDATISFIQDEGPLQNSVELYL
jgi:hypothetical protein